MTELELLVPINYSFKQINNVVMNYFNLNLIQQHFFRKKRFSAFRNLLLMFL